MARPIAHRVDTVLAHARKTELARDAFAIQNECRSRERAGSEWENVSPNQTIAKPFCVAFKCLHLPQQVMRKSDRLGTLQMRVTGHHNIDMFFGEIE